MISLLLGFFVFVWRKIHLVRVWILLQNRKISHHVCFTFKNSSLTPFLCTSIIRLSLLTVSELHFVPLQHRYILKCEPNQYWKQQAVGQKTISLLMHYCLSTPSLFISIILTNHIWKDNTECQIKEAFYSQIASPCTHAEGSSSGFDATPVTVS